MAAARCDEAAKRQDGQNPMARVPGGTDFRWPRDFTGDIRHTPCTVIDRSIAIFAKLLVDARADTRTSARSTHMAENFMRFKPVFLAALLIISSTAGAQQQQQPQQEAPSAPDRMDRLCNQTQIYDVQSRATPEVEARAFRSACMQVTGLETYCGCLQAKLPTAFTFDSYVVLLSRSKQDNGYHRMDKKAKMVYDAIPQTRDSCAATLSAK